MPTCENVFRTAGLKGYIGNLAATGTACAWMSLQTSGGTSLAELVFSSPTAFAVPTNGVSSAGAIAQEASAVAGTIAKVIFYDGNSVAQMTCTIATASASATDFVIGSLDLTAGDVITCTAIVLTCPAT